ncbi:MAG TPA: FGGY-family carbohydrate kinase [Candidatus Dormibacteraeota bacterium]|nr:FGGY-family carbohydrate kinase [Candidatus Dormibacteraeota bacterium]
MSTDLLLGVDVGTASSKAVLASPTGEVIASAELPHPVSTPQPGHVEQDAEAIWWADLVRLARRLRERVPAGGRIAGVGLSAIGPCLLPLDDRGRPLRPGILYGVDTRASQQIAELEARWGEEELRRFSRMPLTSQSIGPKILWLRQHEPHLFARARWLVTATTYLVHRLTGAMVLDRHTASYFQPLIDLDRLEWTDRFAADLVDLRLLPRLGWCDEVAGRVTAEAAAATGIPEGTPVTVGAVDALAEAVSVGVVEPGDLMVMYGSTMFFIAVTDRLVPSTVTWTTAGVRAGRWNVAAGMATSGAATAWFRDQLARDLDTDGRAYALLAEEAAASPPGANGLLFLPYLSGERTPLNDPLARGVIAGLRLDHTRADLYRALLEGIALAAAHNLETMRDMGVQVRRAVAVGGGTRNPLWLQLVSDATGLEQEVPRTTLGAAYGDAFLAGIATGLVSGYDALRSGWVRPGRRVRPDPAAVPVSRERFALFRRLYEDSRSVVHELAWRHLEGASTR